MQIEIRELTADDVAIYWPLRLRALRDDPEAFGSSYEEEQDRSLESVTTQFQTTIGNGGFALGAFADGRHIGVVRLIRESVLKERHIGHIYGMYVAPEARGQHVGRLLMEAAIARARSAPGLEQLHLTVVTTQTPARALYRSLGFVSHGSMPHALKLPDGRYLDEDLMVLWLHDEPASE